MNNKGKITKIVPTNAVTIPLHATKVFSGILFDVFQWPQEMFDGTSATFEMIRRPDTAGTIAVKDGQIVILHEEQPNLPPYYSIPIGRHDVPGESILQGAQRELAEETGMYFKTWRLIQISQPIAKAEWFVYLYLATDFERQESSTKESAGEKITVSLVDFEEARALALHPKNRHIPRDIFESTETLDALLNAPDCDYKEVEVIA